MRLASLFTATKPMGALGGFADRLGTGAAQLPSDGSQRRAGQVPDAGLSSPPRRAPRASSTRPSWSIRTGTQKPRVAFEFAISRTCAGSAGRAFRAGGRRSSTFRSISFSLGEGSRTPSPRPVVPGLRDAVGVSPCSAATSTSRRISPVEDQRDSIKPRRCGSNLFTTAGLHVSLRLSRLAGQT